MEKVARQVMEDSVLLRKQPIEFILESWDEKQAHVCSHDQPWHTLQELLRIHRRRVCHENHSCRPGGGTNREEIYYQPKIDPYYYLRSQIFVVC